MPMMEAIGVRRRQCCLNSCQGGGRVDNAPYSFARFCQPTYLCLSLPYNARPNNEEEAVTCGLFFQYQGMQPPPMFHRIGSDSQQELSNVYKKASSFVGRDMRSDTIEDTEDEREDLETDHGNRNAKRMRISGQATNNEDESNVRLLF
jgi:hypothetical protein